MPTFYSEQATALNASPARRDDAGERVRTKTAVYTTDGTEVQGDVIQMVTMDANSIVLGGYVKSSADAGTATMDVGITGGTTDAFLDGIDIGAGATFNRFAPADATDEAALVFSSADTIDILIKTATGALTAGVTFTMQVAYIGDSTVLDS